MFAYVYMRHEKMPITFFRVWRGNRHLVYCRNILGLTACGATARIAKQRYLKMNAEVIDVCARVGQLMQLATSDLVVRMEENHEVASEADTVLFTILSLTHAKRLDALLDAFREFTTTHLSKEEYSRLITRMELLLEQHTREDFAVSREHIPTPKMVVFQK